MGERGGKIIQRRIEVGRRKEGEEGERRREGIKRKFKIAKSERSDRMGEDDGMFIITRKINNASTRRNRRRREYCHLFGRVDFNVLIIGNP